MEISEIRKKIEQLNFNSSGSSCSKGSPYQEIYFEDFAGVSPARSGSRERVECILKSLDVRGKTVLDIGCNLGFFCFALNANGANAIGLDHDAESITVAKLLAQHYGVKGVSFIAEPLNFALCARIVSEHGFPDIILLNSVVHWLMAAHDTEENVARILSMLLAPDKAQSIFYEPSSSGAAYYPEMLSARAVESFFSQIGVFKHRKAGSFYVSNVAQYRDYFFGTRDINETLDKAARLLDEAEAKGKIGCTDSYFGAARMVRMHKGKIVIEAGNVIIKSHQAASAIGSWLVRHEQEMLSKFDAVFSPLMIAHGERSGRYLLIFKRFAGRPISDGWIRKTDVPFIEQQLERLLGDLAAAGIIHSDLRPHNLLWDPKEKRLQVIDFEFALPAGGGTDSISGAEEIFLAACTNDSERAFMRAQFKELGGKWRSPAGAFSYANDRHAVRTTLNLIKNRSRYLRKRVMEWILKAAKSVVRWVFGRISPQSTQNSQRG